MENQEELINELERDISNLLESPPSYMRQIAKFSKKVINLEIKYILYVINKIKKTIIDPSQSIKKKLFAFRFIKDTLLLASHSFYILTITIIFPLIIQVLEQGNKSSDNGLECLIKLIGPNPEVSNAIEIKTFSTTILQLFTEMMKWSGTYIKMHPFYKIPFSSTFKLHLEALPKVKSLKITQLTYYTTDSVKTYQQNYLQKELSSQQEHVRQDNFIKFLLNTYISLPQDDQDKQKSLEMLQKIVETGDSIFINLMVENLKQMLESEITGYQSILIVHNLFKVKQLQFITLARDELLHSLTYYIMMMSKEKFSQLERIDFNHVLKLVLVWKKMATKMGLQTKTFDQFFNKMKQQRIYENSSQFTNNIQEIQKDFYTYRHHFSYQKLQQINSEKKSHLNLKENDKSITKILNLKYKMRNDFNKLMFSNENISNVSNNSIKRDNNSFNQENSLFNKKDNNNNQQSSLGMINSPQQQQNLNQNSSYSPIKRLKMSNIDKSLEKNNNKQFNQSEEEYIRFNNSLNNLSSSSKQFVLEIQQKDKANIYTSKQQNEDKRQVLSRSSLSNKSSRSKKSLDKFQKASSFGFGLNKVKSSKIIKYSQNSQFNESNNKSKQALKNQNKINLIKFDESSHLIKQKHGQSMQSDNNPYKQEPSNSVNSHHFYNNNNKTKNSTSSSQRKLLKNQEVILVEETVKKPKFGFTKNIDAQTSNNSISQLNNLKQASISDFNEQTSTDRSMKVDPQLISEDKLSKYSSIPSDFNVAFKSNKKNKENSKSDSGSKLNIKFNRFPNKLKQIQLEIQKAKQFQLLYQQKMKQKDQQFQNLQKNLPPTHQNVYQQNQKLKNQLQQKQKRQVQKLISRQKRSLKSPNTKIKLKQEIPFLPNKIFSLGNFIPFDPEFRKQMISNKCLLEKNEIFQLGYAFKKQLIQQLTSKKVNYSISFYFKFKIACEKFQIKFKKQSLNVVELIDTSHESIVANKQMKFQQKIIGYTLFNQQFMIPQLQIQTKIDQKLLTSINEKKRKIKQNLCQQKYTIKVPCSLFNFLDFHTPSTKIEFIKTKYAIQAQFSTAQYCQSLQGQFLLNCFKCGKWHQNQEGNGGFYVSYYTYIKDVKEKKKNDGKNITVNFHQLSFLQRKQVNLYIRKLNEVMFYIESDNDFEADKVVLTQISKLLAR